MIRRESPFEVGFSIGLKNLCCSFDVLLLRRDIGAGSLSLYPRAYESVGELDYSDCGATRSHLTAAEPRKNKARGVSPG